MARSSTRSFEPGRSGDVDKQQKAVLAGIAAELLPVFRQRAQEAEDGRGGPASPVKALAGAGLFRLLHGRFRRAQGEPGHVLHRRPAHRQRVRLDRLIASVIGVHPWRLRPVPAAGPARRLGTPTRPPECPRRTPTGKASSVRGMGRVREQEPLCAEERAGRGYQLDGAVKFLLRLRPRQLGLRRHRRQRRGPAVRLLHVPAAGQRLHHRRRVGHGRAARHRQQRHRGGRGVRPRARSLSFTHVPRCACQGQELNTGALYRIPFGSMSSAITTPIIGMATARTRPTSPTSAAGSGPPTSARRRPRTRSGRCGSPRPQPCSTGHRAERDMTELMAHARAAEKIPLPLRLRPPRPGHRHRPGHPGGRPCCSDSGGPALKTGSADPAVLADAHASRVHAINDQEQALSMFGRGEFGHDVPPDAMF